MSLKNGYLAIALLGGASLAACSNTAAGVEKDAARAGEKAAVVASEAQAATKDAAAETKAVVSDVVAAAVETISVKSALMADRTVDSSRINVDTLRETKTVVLKGSVKTAAQRDEAARIAAASAPGYRIDNQLIVVPNP